ncbi:hypothetical protein [Sphingomonas gellani]|nr:hypothetical protein [Sphingomonas gellani]
MRGLVSALLLALAGTALAWLCFRTAMVKVLPPTTPLVAQLAPHNADVVLSKATRALVQPGSKGESVTLDSVRRAAAAAPLDARPYLIVGQQQLASDPRRGVATLEAGQRLNPRQRIIHVLLLEQYLRTEKYDQAAAQFSVLARLVSQAQQPIAKGVALMAMAPDTRVAVQRTLRKNPNLERTVLALLAQGDASPASIFDLASPAALANAGDKDSWGPVLVMRLAESGRYDEAHAVWQRIYSLSDTQIGAPIFNAGFQTLPASPPFNWTLAAGTLGAADLRNGSLAVDYYGRDSGDLARQLLILRPGRYRFSFASEGGKSDAASSLGWHLVCTTGDKSALMSAPVVGSSGTRRTAVDFTVPQDCSAQSLTLRGEAGEFPAPLDTTLRNLALSPINGARP